MDSNKNPIDRQSSLKLKDRWINAFQNENLIDSRSTDDGPDPKEGEDPKDQDLECNEDLYLDEAGPRDGGYLRNVSEYIKVVKVLGDLENDADEEEVGDADEEEDDDHDEEEGCDEFRDRVASVSELQRQLEELMRALINLQISRIPPADLRLDTVSLDSGVEGGLEHKFQPAATSTSSPSPNLSPTLASLRASLNSLNDSAGNSKTSSLALDIESRYRPRPSSVPDGNMGRLSTPNNALARRGQSLNTTQDPWKVHEKFGKAKTLEEEKSRRQEVGSDMTRIGSQAKAAKLLGIENLPNHLFSFQGQNNNDSHLREAADHRERIASLNGEELCHGHRRLSKAARILGLANIPDHPHQLLEENVVEETLHKHMRSISPTKAGLVSPSTQQSLQRGSWEKAAKVLGVDKNFEPTFSKEKRGQKDFDPKEEKARQRGRNDGTKGRRDSKMKNPQKNEIEDKGFVDVSQKL